MKAILASLTFAAIVQPLTAGTHFEMPVIARVMEYHFQRTQPFFRGKQVIASGTRAAAAPDETLMVREVVTDSSAAAEIARAFQEQVPSVQLDPSAIENVADLSKFKIAEGYDWRRVAQAYPELIVMFEVSRPIFDPNSQNAVVRLDGRYLRGNNVGRSFSILYGVRRATDTHWEVTRFVAPCCAQSANK